MTARTRLTLALSLVLCAAAPALAQQPDPFAPLNLLLNAARLNELRGALAAGDPLVSSWRDQVVRDAAPFLARSPDPIVGVLKVPGYYTSRRAEQQAITRRLRGDASGAHALALAYALTGDAQYADQAERYVFAWVDSCTRPQDGGAWWNPIFRRGDTPIVMTYSFPSFFYAYDILRGLGRIDPAEHARFVNWLRPFVDYERREEPYRDNGHAWQALFLASAAHVTQDRGLFATAIDYHRRGFDVAPCPDGALGRELLRAEKAATYSLMAIEALLQTVAIGERHGFLGLRDQRATRTPLGLSAPLPGVSVHDVVDREADFLDDPAAWHQAHRLAIHSSVVNGPSRPAEWGWCFELAGALWTDPRHATYTGDAPYGLLPARAYTLAFATVYFRPLPGRPSPL